MFMNVDVKLIELKSIFSRFSFDVTDYSFQVITGGKAVFQIV